MTTAAFEGERGRGDEYNRGPRSGKSRRCYQTMPQFITFKETFPTFYRDGQRQQIVTTFMAVLQDHATVHYVHYSSIATRQVQISIYNDANMMGRSILCASLQLFESLMLELAR